MFDRAMRELGASVTGRQACSQDYAGARTRGAVEAILAYYGARPVEVPKDVTELRDVLEYQLHPTGICLRTVRLPKGWHKDAVGALLALDAQGDPVALLPQARGGYAYVD